MNQYEKDRKQLLAERAQTAGQLTNREKNRNAALARQPQIVSGETKKEIIAKSKGKHAAKRARRARNYSRAMAGAVLIIIIAAVSGLAQYGPKTMATYPANVQKLNAELEAIYKPLLVSYDKFENETTIKTPTRSAKNTGYYTQFDQQLILRIRGTELNENSLEAISLFVTRYRTKRFPIRRARLIYLIDDVRINKVPVSERFDIRRGYGRRSNYYRYGLYSLDAPEIAEIAAGKTVEMSIGGVALKMGKKQKRDYEAIGKILAVYCR